jgi:hypothetical protein
MSLKNGFEIAADRTANDFGNVVEFNAAAQHVAPALMALKASQSVTPVAGNAALSAGLVGQLNVNEAQNTQAYNQTLGLNS